jgi:hypothetical protein
MAGIPPLKRTSPEAKGIPSAAIRDFIRAVEQHTHPLDALHGFMLLRHGNVAAEGWWAPSRRSPVACPSGRRDGEKGPI